MKNKKQNKKRNLQSSCTSIILDKKRSYVIDTRCKNDGETYELSQKLTLLGVEVHTVLNKSRVIFGKCSDTVLHLIKVHPLIKHIEFDE